MLETSVTPDFIVVDGGEGGTGAAPIEFSNHVGPPLSEGLSFVHNALVGAGLRDRIKLGASRQAGLGLSTSAARLAIGADYAIAARGFMFAVGCIQSGSATPTTARPASRPRTRCARALVVADKAPRVANFHRNTLRALAELLGAAGLNHPNELKPWHLQIRH